MDTFIVNGAEYRVGFTKLTRSYRKEYKYKVTTEDGVAHSEVRAVYVDFSLALGNMDAAEYDRLMAALLTATGDVTVTLPSGATSSGTYTGEFDGVSDEVTTGNDTETFWDNLTLDFIGTVPVEVGG